MPKGRTRALQMTATKNLREDNDMNNIFIITFCLVFSELIFAQSEPGSIARHNLKWSTPTVGVEGLASHSYSRFSGYTQFGHLRLTGALVNSEGNPFGQLTTGWTFTPIKAEHTEFFVEPEIGSAITAGKTRPVLGLRLAYQSRKWFIESWCTAYPGKNSWVNCEPLVDAMHSIGKGFYAGWVSSSFIGVPKHANDHGKKPSHPKSVRDFFGGVGLVYRRSHFDLGVSYEFGLNKGAQNYVAFFGSHTF